MKTYSIEYWGRVAPGPVNKMYADAVFQSGKLQNMVIKDRVPRA